MDRDLNVHAKQLLELEQVQLLLQALKFLSKTKRHVLRMVDVVFLVGETRPEPSRKR